MSMNLEKNSCLNFLLALACLLLTASRVSAQQAAASTPSVSDVAPIASTYRLCPNDVLRVKVFQEDDLTTEIRLGKDGSATFPLLGVINLGGKTVDEAAANIRELLGKD